MTQFQKHLAWLAELAAKPAFTEHAWLRAIQLDETELFHGMWDALSQKITPPSSAVAYRARRMGRANE